MKKTLSLPLLVFVLVVVVLVWASFWASLTLLAQEGAVVDSTQRVMLVPVVNQPVATATPLPTATLPPTATPSPTATLTPVPTATATPLPTATPTQAAQCDPSYPDVCIPSPPPDLDCKHIGYRNFRVVGSDPHRFDGNHDGRGCES